MIDLWQVSQYARWVYRGHVRKFNGKPYHVHPARVAYAATLRRDTTPEIIAACWLHDGPEDHPDRCDVQVIEILFGARVAALVRGMTNIKNPKILSRSEQKYCDRERLANEGDDVHLIKLLDRIDNLNDIDVKADPEWAALYCDESWELLKVLFKGPSDLQAELRKTIVDVQTSMYAK